MQDLLKKIAEGLVRDEDKEEEGREYVLVFKTPLTMSDIRRESDEEADKT